mgnify:CR=1 FL=1
MDIKPASQITTITAASYLPAFFTSTFLKFMYNETDDLNYCSNNRTIL